MKRTIVLLPLLMALLVGCSYSSEMQEMKIDNRFSIKVVGYLSPSGKLHPNPDLQYENRFRTVYLLVLDTIKTTGVDLDSFSKKAIETLASGSTEKAHWTRVDSVTTINGAPGRQYDMRMIMTGEEVDFKIVTVESKDRFYQALGWTLHARKNRDQYLKDINTMVTSFKLL